MTLQEKYDHLCKAYATDEMLGSWGGRFTVDFRLLLRDWPETIFDMPDNERLGIRGLRMRDGPRGLTCNLGGRDKFWAPCPHSGKAPAFPAQSVRAATWDAALEYEVGEAIGEIGKALDVHVAFLPSINILPWLNWGRSQESYGEDPLLNGKMGAAVVRGLQSQGVMATAKHFLANNIENTRWYVSADMDDKLLHEVYLKQWAIIVAESSPEFVMTSYNRIQGNYPFQVPKYIDILRNRLGFEGSIVSDWWSTMELAMGSQEKSPYHGKDFGWFGNATAILTAGVDVEMPFCNFDSKAVEGLANCAFADAQACQASNVIDRAVAHVLRSKLRYGLIGDRVTPKPHPDPFFAVLKRFRKGLEDSAVAPLNQMKYDELALRVARRGMVLLRNEGGFLPRRPSQVNKVAVLGTADRLEFGDRGSSSVSPSGEVVTVLQGLQVKYGMSKVSFVEDLDGAGAEGLVRGADLVVLDVGYDFTDEGEFVPPATGGDRKHLSLRSSDIDLIKRVSKLSTKVVVVMTSGGAITVEEFVNSVAGIIWMGYPGPLGGRALASILSGDANPSGRMTAVTPRVSSDYLPKGTSMTPWADGDAHINYPYVHGFKHMWEQKIKPRYPLGWGLSYTTYEHGRPSLAITGDSDVPMLAVAVEVSNSGPVAGIEVVQVYASCTACTRKRLPVSLMGFSVTSLLEPGRSEVVSVNISAKDLATYDTEQELWFLEKGEYSIMAGPCADPERLKIVVFTIPEDVTFDYPGPARPPHVLGAGSVDCESFRCRRDEELIAGVEKAKKVAMIANSIILSVVAILFMVVLCCGCRCLRSCCRRLCGCCSKSASANKKKVKRA